MGAITAVLFFALGLVIGRFLLPASEPSLATTASIASASDIEALAAAVGAEVRDALADAQSGPETPQAQAQAQPEPAQPEVVDVSEDDDPALGPPDAKVVVVEFSDYQ